MSQVGDAVESAGAAACPDAGADEVEWLTEEETDAWTAMVSLMLLLPGRLEAQLQRDSGLTLFEYLVMSSLSMVPGRSSGMGALAVLANGSQSRLSNVVKRLESRGWVERLPDPCDGRSTLAHLTDAGMAMVEAAAPGHVRAVRRHVVDPLSPAQQRSLAAIAQRVRETVPEWAGLVPSAQASRRTR